jgi:hypothetical protein
MSSPSQCGDVPQLQFSISALALEALHSRSDLRSLFRVGEVQPRFNAIKAKLHASFNTLETQKVSFEAVEIFTHTKLHRFNIRKISLNDSHIRSDDAKVFEN